MNARSRILAAAAVLGLVFAAASREVLADDIDLYEVQAPSVANAPTVIFLLDNSANWSRSSQKWPDNGIVQGQAEVEAISAVLNSVTFKSPFKIGVAMYVHPTGNQTAGAYIRYAARDMSNTTTNPTYLAQLTSILTEIDGNVTNDVEKASDAGIDEIEGFYEIYKYLKGLTAYAGSAAAYQSADEYQDFNYKKGSTTIVTAAGAQNGNSNNGNGVPAPYALANDGVTYNAPATGCGKTFIIFIANNANANTATSLGGPGSQTYESTTAPLLPDVNGLDPFYLDEWSSYLNKQLGTVTYVLDAYYAQNNAQYSQILENTAHVGGGKYYQVGSKQAIIDALNQIIEEVQSSNSAFSSVSLPVSAANRADSQNQIFLGVFRPDSAPRWLGNLKQYKLGLDSNNKPQLEDFLGKVLINPATGFVTDCAVSTWTADDTSATPGSSVNPAYWYDGVNPSLTASQCITMPTPSNPSLPSGYTAPDPQSDWPDGPIVEKGGVAEVIRRGNNPPTTTTSPTWAVNRNLLTTTSGATPSVTGFTAASSGLGSALVNWITGQDNDASIITPGPEKASDTGNYASNVRQSVHGDVIHSRPVPLNYGSAGVTVYYGANDGMFRAISAADGHEEWAFVAREFYSKFQRQYDDFPIIQFPAPAPVVSGATSKDYFFDGETGVYANFDSSNNISTAWIYPSMRRGGRMIYALDVSTAGGNPTLKWRFGCALPEPDTTSCVTPKSADSTKVTDVGQTWSLPKVGFVHGYTDSNGNNKPVVVMGGGYDTCEDANTASPSCSSPNGASVFVLDADTGQVLRKFTAADLPTGTPGPAMRSIPSDVQFLSRSNNGAQDYVYVADTGGNVYRIDFIDSSGTAFTDPSRWVFHKVAYTSGGGRKFEFPPSLLLAFGGKGAFVALTSGDREHPLASEYPFPSTTFTGVLNRIYVFVDDLTGSSRTAVNLDDTTTTDNLYMQDLTNSTCNSQATCPPSQALTFSTTITPLKAGWFRSFIGNGANGGEQGVNGTTIAGGVVSFATNFPTPPSANSCSSNLGDARNGALNLFEGFGANSDHSIYTEVPGGGLLATGVLVTTTVDGKTETVTIGTGPDCTGKGCVEKPPLPTNRKRSVQYWKSSGDNK